MLPNKCGDGVIQGEEECECVSGTQCKTCSNCKKVKVTTECIRSRHDPCCDGRGKLLTTGTNCKTREGLDGYCNNGICSTGECTGSNGKAKMTLTIVDRTGRKNEYGLDTFCGISASNPCIAKCASSVNANTCREMRQSTYHLQNGALCTRGGVRGACKAGSCEVPVCGNGVIEAFEDCECARGQTQCL